MYMIMMLMMLVIMVYFLFFMMAYKKMLEMESMSSYECGFEPFCKTRISFSFRFFLIAILFLIFDVEISLMLMVPYVWSSIIGGWIFMMFLLILIVGLLYEYYYGALEWLH